MNLPSFSSSPSEREPGVAPEMPATVRADEIVGRWALHRFRIPTTARAPKPRRGLSASSLTSSAPVLPVASSCIWLTRRPRRAAAEGSPSGKNYIGPPGPAGGEQDREIISFDGRVLVTRFIDKDAATRYGNMVYVRCGARA